MNELSLGAMIKRLRAASGLNQRQFAEKLEIHPTFLSHLEKNRRDPSVQLLRRMAATLNLPVGLFLALALWTELPADQRELYQQIVQRLIDLAAATQLGLEFEG
jgi:transcriptional regulator with XRE-family HTH domain